MNYNKINCLDIANGPGIRVSIFVQGCTFNCKNCFNPSTHSFSGGKPFTEKELNILLNLCAVNCISGLSILGGEPLHPKNIDEVTNIAKKFKEKYPDKTIWLWTGFKYEQIKDKEILSYLDIIVDGQFEEEHKNIKLLYSGSTNQRVIDIKETRKNNRITIIDNFGV